LSYSWHVFAKLEVSLTPLTLPSSSFLLLHQGLLLLLLLHYCVLSLKALAMGEESAR
jgi:hypothetical protein